MTRALVILDETDRTISPIWKAGAATAAKLPRGRADVIRVHGRGDMRDQLARYRDAYVGPPLDLVSYWGHGNVGALFVDGYEIFPDYDLGPYLRPLLAPSGIVWLRACSTFARLPGQRWARDAASMLGCRVAGFTHIIHALQSGLCVLAPGQTPDWDPDEGGGAVWSTWRAPRTITALRMSVPDKYLTR